MSSFSYALAARNAARGGGPLSPAQSAPAQVEAAVTYTPNGIPRQPGFFNPTNPYDTGRHGEKNRELNGGQGGSVDWWDYDLGKPRDGAYLDSNGMYSFGSQTGSVGGAGQAKNAYAAGAQLAAGLLGLRGFNPAAPPPLASDAVDFEGRGGRGQAPAGGLPDAGLQPVGRPDVQWEGALNLAALNNILGRPRLAPGGRAI